VTVFWRASAVGSVSARRGVVSAAKAAKPALCSLGVAAVLGATLCSPVAPAGANSISGLQQEAAALSKQMLLEQLQIDGFQQQRVTDMAKVAQDDALLQTLQAQLEADRHRIGEDVLQLRSAAVKDYVDGGTQVDGTNPLFAGTPSNGATTVYTQTMTGDLTVAVSHLQSDRRALRAEQATQEQVIAQVQRQLAGASAALVSAQTTEQNLSQQKASVTGELAVAIAQQQSAEAAAARATAAANTPQTGSGPASPPAGLPQLPPFLQCVVQAESGGNYQAVSPTGQYMGAFQFSQPTWNEAARLAGMPSLIGVPPYEASPRDQDLLAIALYNADGEQPWYDPCRG